MSEALSEPFVDDILSYPEFQDHPMDECGVVGVWAPGQEVLQNTVILMEGLQHRGHSGAGVAYEFGNTGFSGHRPVMIHKGHGRVSQAIPEVYTPGDPSWQTKLAAFEEFMSPNVAIGHTRYSTAESEDISALHPHVLEFGALAHNGEFTNIPGLMWRYGLNPNRAASDTDGFSQVLNMRTEALGDIVPALREVLPHVEGGYCLTILDKGRLIAARDPWGYHPLALGELSDGKGFAIASESVVFESIGATFVRDIEPGELLVINEHGQIESDTFRREVQQLCSVEAIYTAREDGVIDGIQVRQNREYLGQFLAEDQPAEADCVIGIPSTGLAAAKGFSDASGIELVPAITKRQGAPRTFQMRGERRGNAIANKYEFREDLIRGKDIVLVDDSSIKGNTHKAVVPELRRLGARKIHLRLSAWPYRYPCFMGMDTHDPDNLVASRMTLDEFAADIGVDSIGYNTPERIQEAASKASLASSVAQLCISCYSGQYATKLPASVNLGIPKVRTSAFQGIAGQAIAEA